MQNHMMQIFSFMAMECPTSFNARAISEQKVKLLEAVEPVDPKECLYGQYISSKNGRGYKEEETVLDKNSTTPTFCTCVLRIRNERWKSVPFYLIAGKALNENLMEIRINLKKPEYTLYENIYENAIIIRIQPDESIYVELNSKVPELKFQIVKSKLEQKYESEFANKEIPNAYTRMLFEAIQGNQNNFVDEREICAAWKIFDQILDNRDIPLEEYPYGSNGPERRW